MSDCVVREVHPTNTFVTFVRFVVKNGGEISGRIG